MMELSALPQRMRVIVLGGGIHGVGVAHDLASRGWKDVLLVEKGQLGSGTSSKSTKLIHGGLRYLQNLRDFSMVSEALAERKLLIELAPDLVHPLPFVFPILKKGGMPGFMVRTGLCLYDLLAGFRNIARHDVLTTEEVQKSVPVLQTDLFRKFYRFYDGQTDDLGLVLRVAGSARSCGAEVLEHVHAEKAEAHEDGWHVTLRAASGEKRKVSCLYLVNCLGSWANQFIEQSSLQPMVSGINVQGSHLVFPNMGLQAGLFLQSPEDGRIFFILPWLGHTLIGTTEKTFQGNPDDTKPSEEELLYLLEHCNRYLKTPLSLRDAEVSFSGLRWLVQEKSYDVTRTSRSHVLTTHRSGRGIMLSIYGGKLTSYRSLAQQVGDHLCRHFGEFRPSCTHEISAWEKPQHTGPQGRLDPVRRFITG